MQPHQNSFNCWWVPWCSLTRTRSTVGRCLRATLHPSLFNMGGCTFMRPSTHSTHSTVGWAPSCSPPPEFIQQGQARLRVVLHPFNQFKLLPNCAFVHGIPVAHLNFLSLACNLPKVWAHMICVVCTSDLCLQLTSQLRTHCDGCCVIECLCSTSHPPMYTVGQPAQLVGLPLKLTQHAPSFSQP